MKRVAIALIVVALAACSKRESPEPEPGPPVVATVMPAETADTSVTAEPAETTSKEIELAGKLATYSATRLDGTPYVVAEQKGKVLLLNVWATWCGPCRFEIPELQKMQAESGSKGLEVVGISVDEKPNNEQEVREFVKEKAIDYPIVLDPDGRILLLLETSSVPTTVLLDRKGQVVWYAVGIVQADNPALAEALTKALEQ